MSDKATDVVHTLERPTRRAPKESFTGDVWVDDIVQGTMPSRLRAGIVSFSPGARTAWHSHPVGQTLYVLSGVGRYQRKGKPVEELQLGDTVMIPPNALHWHGAAPDRIFSHLALSEVTDKGEGTIWAGYVTDEEYAAPPAST